MKVVCLLSGGMDSATALWWAKQSHEVVGCLSFWYGSKHNSQEGAASREIANTAGVPWLNVPLDFVAKNFKSDLLQTGGPVPEGHYEDPTMKKTVVPFRNGIMLSVAAGFAESVGAEAVVIANHAGDHAIYPDCRVEFIEHMGRAIKTGTYGEISILAPFSKISKAEIARLGGSWEVPYHLTYSCYVGDKTHCGRCGTCTERKEAFKLGGVIDPTTYAG